MPGKLFGTAFGIVLLGACLMATPAGAQSQAGQVTAQTAAEKALLEACTAPYGLKPAEKVQACSKAIESGALKSVSLAMAFYNRASALANEGDQAAAKADYRQALRVFTDVLRTSAPSGPLLFQRGAIYQMIGDADQAVVDYSDSIRIAPGETYAYINRGIVLYTKKDNNEGAIADFNAAIKINRREVSAWSAKCSAGAGRGDLRTATGPRSGPAAPRCAPGWRPSRHARSARPNGPG